MCSSDLGVLPAQTASRPSNTPSVTRRVSQPSFDAEASGRGDESAVAGGAAAILETPWSVERVRVGRRGPITLGKIAKTQGYIGRLALPTWVDSVEMG